MTHFCYLLFTQKAQRVLGHYTVRLRDAVLYEENFLPILLDLLGLLSHAR